MHAPRRLCTLFVAMGAIACHEPVAPRVELVIDTPPAFIAKTISTTYKEFIQPRGILTRQYEIWLAIPPSVDANAGVVVARDTPTFIRAAGTLLTASPADIAPGDSLLVWHDSFVAYGSVQAPPGAPAYSGTQIVIAR